jgi:hypothetical protein
LFNNVANSCIQSLLSCMYGCFYVPTLLSIYNWYIWTGCRQSINEPKVNIIMVVKWRLKYSIGQWLKESDDERWGQNHSNLEAAIQYSWDTHGGLWSSELHQQNVSCHWKHLAVFGSCQTRIPWWSYPPDEWTDAVASRCLWMCFHNISGNLWCLLTTSGAPQHASRKYQYTGTNQRHTGNQLGSTWKWMR